MIDIGIDLYSDSRRIRDRAVYERINPSCKGVFKKKNTTLVSIRKGVLIKIQSYKLFGFQTEISTKQNHKNDSKL